MASNEIELTFIRCPSCKSLMPSTANKCGMCGLNMTDEDFSSTEKKPRIRQRTTSDLSRGIESDEAQEEVSKAEPERQLSSQYKDLFEPESNEESKIEETKNKKPDFFPKVEFPEDQRYESEQSSEENDDDEDVAGDDDEDFNSDNQNDGLNASRDDAAPKRKRRRRKKKRVPQADSDNLEPEKNEVKNSASEERVSSNWGSREEREDFKESEKKSENPPQKEDRVREASSSHIDVPEREVRNRESAIEKETSASSSNRDQDLKADVIEEAKASPVKNENIGRKMNESNKLLGWFVNYSTDSNGKYFEIRTGKKFIGRQELREHDLIIPDSAISTPHCLLNAEGGKLGLQDLMSDQGTFVKAVGENEFRKIDSTVTLKHGDILKLGTYELIVCLIPTA